MAMATTSTLFFFLLLITATTAVNGLKKTHLHFYFQGRFAGPNATLVTVAKTSQNSTTFTFGSVSVLDDLLTKLPDLASTEVGRCQGIVAQAQLNGPPASVAVENLIFTAGKYNGSTLAIVGRVAAPGVFEMPVVGGTGLFRLAQGYALVKPFSIDINAGRSVVEYHVYVLHP